MYAFIIILFFIATSTPKEAFPKQCLDSHNEFRLMHSVPALTWAEDLAKEAQAWAEKLARARTLQHASKSERKEAGENIAMFTGSYESAGEKATTMWLVNFIRLENNQTRYRLKQKNCNVNVIGNAEVKVWCSAKLFTGQRFKRSTCN